MRIPLSKGLRPSDGIRSLSFDHHVLLWDDAKPLHQQGPCCSQLALPLWQLPVTCSEPCL